MTAVLTLNVKIGADELQLLKEGEQNLCLARSVQSGTGELKGNVVFSTIPHAKLASNLTLKWSEEYQVFLATQFKASRRAGVQVTAAANPKNIKGGQTAHIDADSIITVNGPQKAGQPFTVQNEWQAGAYIGVNNKDAVTGTFATIYVSLPTLLHETTDLLPIQSYSVFWDRNFVTNTMFEHGHTPTFDFDLTGKTEITIKYENDEWSLE